MGDVWAAGEQYESYVGRWSRVVAARFLDWLAVPGGRRWLDVGCGTGALCSAVLAGADPASMIGVDPSAGFVAHSRQHVTDGRARFAQADARHLPLRDGAVDTVVSGLVLNFVPDPGRATAELARVVGAGGTVAAYVWDYSDGMELMRHFWDAAIALDHSAAGLDESRRFPMCRPEPLQTLWTVAGLSDVEVVPIDVPTVFASFTDYWSPFLGGQGPAPTYVTSLPPERRDALAELLSDRLPVAPDGSIALTARAWAIKGRC